MKTALIDADSIIHIVAYHNAVSEATLEMFEDVTDLEEKEEIIMQMYGQMDKEPVFAHVDQFINDIILSAGCDHYLGFLGTRTGSNTFRHKLAKTKPYKGNRKSSPHWTKFWKPLLIGHMVDKWKFIELSNIEADDAVIMCAAAMEDTVICSPDKDLKQIEGNFYDYKKCEHSSVTKEEAIKNLYTQTLVGDSVDNVGGAPRVGRKSKFLEFPDCKTPEDFHKYTFEIFKLRGVPEMMEEQLALVYMLRKPDGIDITEIPTPLPNLVLGDKTEEIVQEEEAPIKFEPPTFTQ